MIGEPSISEAVKSIVKLGATVVTDALPLTPPRHPAKVRVSTANATVRAMTTPRIALLMSKRVPYEKFTCPSRLVNQ